MPNPKDPFPDIDLSPGLGEETGPLLAVSSPGKLSLHWDSKVTLYENIVKATNKEGLNGRPPRVWRPGWAGTHPQGRVLYKPPLRQTAHLQWRVLDGAVVSNAIVSVLNTAVSNKCPFCVFHVFIE